MIMSEQRRVMSVPDFLELIKNQRDTQDLRLLHIERQTGVARHSLRRLLAGVGKCRLTTLESIAQYYDAEVAIVFKQSKKKGLGIPEE